MCDAVIADGTLKIAMKMFGRTERGKRVLVWLLKCQQTLQSNNFCQSNSWSVLLLSLDIVGGAELSSLETALVVESLAYGCSAIQLCIMGPSLAIAPVLLAGNEEQKKKYLGMLTVEPVIAVRISLFYGILLSIAKQFWEAILNTANNGIRHKFHLWLKQKSAFLVHRIIPQVGGCTLGGALKFGKSWNCASEKTARLFEIPLFLLFFQA